MSHFWNVPSHFLSSLFSVLFFSGCQRTHIDMYLNQMHRHDVKKVYYFQKDTLKSQIFIRRVYLNELTTTCSNLPSIGVQLLLLLLTSFSAKASLEPIIWHKTPNWKFIVPWLLTLVRHWGPFSFEMTASIFPMTLCSIISSFHGWFFPLALSKWFVALKITVDNKCVISQIFIINM